MRDETLQVKRTIDYLLLVVVIGISLFGTYMILSATYYMNIFDESSNPLITFVDAFKETALGFGVMIVAIFFDAKWIKRLAPIAMFVAIGLLFATLIFGISKNGAMRWLKIGPLSFATSEVAKIAAILYFPRVLEHLKKSYKAYQRGWLSIFLFGGVSLVLIFLQNDLSSSIVYVAILGAMLLVSGGKLTHIGSIVVIGIIFIAIAIVGTPYRMDRIESWMADNTTLTGDAAQANQSLMAIANGGVAGVGAGEAYQTKNGHAQSESDFIFSTVAETTGFIGSVILITAYVFMLWRLVRIAILSRTMYGALVVTGVLTMIGTQAAVHLMYTTKLMPTTGITLPLVSSGGTSTIILLGAIGIALNFSSNPEGL